MQSILLVVGCALAYLVAYHTYGKFLARTLFKLSTTRPTPAVTLNDGQDYVPSKKEIIFGHHFTSIAGTGPIVGPAIGIIWGWIPALIWILLGSIFMGAVHDFGALAISLRHEGKSIGEITGKIISKRVQFMFLLIIFLTLVIVIAIFCLVIAVLFKMYPSSVFSIWMEVPIAITLGVLIYKFKLPHLPFSILALLVLFAAIWVGTKFPITLGTIAIPGTAITLNPIIIWSVLLLIYVSFASTLPVTTLLQPRDYINGHKLFVVMTLLILGVVVSRPEIVAPAFQAKPAGAPPLWPFLFITIACGAVSGFHSLVSSGTTSKQLSLEKDALFIGYGSMLMEGMLAVLVLIAVAGGIALLSQDGMTGSQIWNEHYKSWQAAQGLGSKVNVFVVGSANMLTYIGIPLLLGKTLMGVFVASFAGTTIDTATRLQRYVIAELGKTVKLNFLCNKYIATAVAVISAGALALCDGKGTGGLMLWPMFGATNQLLAALALLVITVYLLRRRKPIIFTFIPLIAMLVMTGWALCTKMMDFYNTPSQTHLFIITGLVVALEIWMIIEATIVMTYTYRRKRMRALKA